MASSPRFLVWTAISCALGVGVCMWIADGSSNGVRAIAALIGLGVGLLVVLLIAWALAPEDEVVAASAVPVVEPMPAPVVPAPVLAPQPVTPPAPVAEPVPPADLAKQLEKGRSLDPEPAAIDAWIDETRTELAQHRPGVLGYFAALGSRTFADDRARLDAHLARLETIVRDMA